MIRYQAEWALPEQAYLPGRSQRPGGDGHGSPFEAGDEPLSRNLLLHPQYRYGVDLINHGYYWEAHESLEHVWNDLGRTGGCAGMMRGLIQISAALLKRRMGDVASSRRLWGRGMGYVADALEMAGKNSPWRFDAGRWKERCEAWENNGRGETFPDIMLEV